MKARIAFAGPQSDIAELQYIGSSSAATREEMDSIGEATKSAQVECDAARAEQEKLGRVMIGVRAGLGHLQDMLRVRLRSCLLTAAATAAAAALAPAKVPVSFTVPVTSAAVAAPPPAPQEIPKGRTTISSAPRGNELVDSLLHVGDQISYVVDMCSRDPHALQVEVAFLRGGGVMCAHREAPITFPLYMS